MDYVEPDELSDEELSEPAPAVATVNVQFKSGSTKSVTVNLPTSSSIFDTVLTSDNFLEYVSSPYNFSEGAFLVIPTEEGKSHIFIEISATDFVEVKMWNP